MSTEPKHIWIVSQYSVLPTSFGSTRHLDLASSLNDKNYTFAIISSSYNNFERRKTINLANKLFVKQSISPKIDFLWLKSINYDSNGIRRLINNFVFAHNIKKISNLIKTPDLILGSSPELLSSYEALRLAKRFKVPFVFEVRDIWPDSLLELGLGKANPLIIFYRYLEKKLMLESDKIIAIMPLLARYATARFNLKKDKIEWISNGIKDEKIKKFVPPPKHEGFLVTYAGTIGKTQDIENIINATSLLTDYPQIKLQIIGEGVSKKKCMKLSQDLGLQARIQFNRPVAKSKLLNKLKESDALILCLKKKKIHRFGCQTLKMFDYLATGRPIILSGSIARNPLSDSKCWIKADPEKPEDIAKAILKIYNLSPNQRKRMSLEALKHAWTNYRMSLLGEKLNKVLVELFGN